MLYNKVLNKEFATKEEMTDALVENKKLLIDAKKSELKTKVCDFHIVPSKDGEADKTLLGDASKIEFGSTIYAVINTTNWLDSHEDVHAKSIWNKSAKEQNGKTYFVCDHKLDVTKVIATPDDVNILLKELDWSELGVDLKGKTTALIFETKLQEYANESYVKLIKAGKRLQHSIRMRYIDVALCVNDKKHDAEYKNWVAFIGEVANRKEAEELGYFYYIKEAAIAMEGSAVVFGSNSATPTLTELPKNENSTEPTEVTQEIKSNSKYSYYKTNH